jgi:adenosylcobinamide-phosphate synthase
MLLSLRDPSALLASLMLALVLDAVFGEPGWLWNRVAHPVALAGRLIDRCDRRLNRPRLGATERRIRGTALIIALLALAILVGLVLSRLFVVVPGGWVFEAIVVSALLAQRSLYDHVRAVADAFRSGGLEAARSAVADIVGRDPTRLDDAGVCRAAIESLAENHNDGIVAPVFWYTLFGLPGLFAYKMLNTADSMIGYRNDRYRDFGWAAARLDDGANYVAARLDALLLALAASFVPADGFATAWRTAKRDGPRHRSVNAGWPEGAMAGALGLALAGPRSYGGETVDDAWMNADGSREATPEDIDRALVLYVAATGVLWAATIAALLTALWLS